MTEKSSQNPSVKNCRLALLMFNSTLDFAVRLWTTGIRGTLLEVLFWLNDLPTVSDPDLAFWMWKFYNFRLLAFNFSHYQRLLWMIGFVVPCSGRGCNGSYIICVAAPPGRDHTETGRCVCETFRSLSMTMRKNVGESTEPCWTPRETEKGWILIWQQKEVVIAGSEEFQALPFTPASKRDWSKMQCSMESKAFYKS